MPLRRCVINGRRYFIVQVQDFRFLCPNNTAFDQENQICDDWYNIDCEAATLYYSDNFDLYRLGKLSVYFIIFIGVY